VIRKGRSARGPRGLLAALLAIAIAAAAMTGTAFAADAAGNGSNGPEIAHLALGNSLQPASLRSHSDTTYGWCAAEISYWEYVECPSIPPPGTELENTSREDDGLDIWACPFTEEPVFCHAGPYLAADMDSPGDTAWASISEGDVIIMSGHDAIEAVPVAASIVAPSAGAARTALDLPGRLLFSTKAADPLSAALARLHSAEAGANAAIDRFNRGQGSAAAVQANVGAARSAVSSLRGPFVAQQPRSGQGAKAKAALLGVLGDEASACRELDLALSGGAPSAQSIRQINIDLRTATSEARAAVKIVTGRELPARHG
jgi:hypothetical protein